MNTTAEKSKSTRRVNIKKLAIAAVLCAVAVVGSALQFEAYSAQCAPVQHMVNVLCAVLLGPGYGVGAAFVSSLLRNILGLGTPAAFPGSMIGALLGGLVYMLLKKKNFTLALVCTIIAEIIGTGVIGALCAYPVALLFMDKDPATLAFFFYVPHFLFSSAVGSVISGVLIVALDRAKVLRQVQKSLE